MSGDAKTPPPDFGYSYLTEEVEARVRSGELLSELILAVVHAAADYDMYATGKVDANMNDHESSYWYFRAIIDKLGIPPQAIIDAIDECYPDDAGSNLTEPANSVVQASTS